MIVTRVVLLVGAGLKGLQVQNEWASPHLLCLSACTERHKEGPANPCWCGERRGQVQPSSPPATPMWGLVIAKTLDHIYLQFTPSCLDLWAIQGITFPTESKQAGLGVEGWMDGGREKRPGHLCVNAARDCKASWAMTAKCANFLLGLELCLTGRQGAATLKDQWTSLKILLIVKTFGNSILGLNVCQTFKSLRYCET